MLELERLFEAAKTGEVAQVREIISRHPELRSARRDNGDTPLMAALYRGQRDVVQLLIDSGADLDVFAAAATGRLRELTGALRSAAAVSALSYDGWTALHLAAFFGHLDATRSLLDAGADVNVVSRNTLTNTPLHAAAAGKHVEVALLLLERGASCGTADAGGYTALQIATENRLQPVLDKMVEPEHGLPAS
ncbi:MAG: ankyrin repeat domain-containing protein [Vicinamibacterales bacterium]